jgi:hypothetical protein
MDQGIALEGHVAHRPSSSLAAAIALSLLIGGAVGSIVTRAVVHTEAAAPARAVATWDPQKLEAMAGRLLFTPSDAPVATGWDPQKLEAMAGRLLAG